MVLLAVGAAEQFALRGDVQRHVALDLDGSDDEYAGGHQHRAALVLMARIDGGLQRVGVESLAIALRAEVDDVVDADAVVCRSGRGLAARRPADRK